MCKSDIEKALNLDNELPDADIARGFYYFYCKDDAREALKYFRLASEKNPDNYQPLFYMAVVYRKMGNWIKSQELLHRVIRYNPKEALFLTNIGLSYTYLHKFDSAIIFHQKAIDAMPQWSPPYENKIDAILLREGDPGIAQSVLDTAIKNTGDNLFEYRILLNIYKGLLPDALNTTEESKPWDYKIDGIKYLYMALINKYLSKKDLAKIYFDSASVLLNLFIAKNPENHKAHGAIGLAYAGLGLKEMAEKEGIKAVDLAGNNSMSASDMKLNLARIYTLCGDYEEASNGIKNCLKNPSSFSEKMLKIDPLWEPVARHMSLKSITYK